MVDLGPFLLQHHHNLLLAGVHSHVLHVSLHWENRGEGALGPDVDTLPQEGRGGCVIGGCLKIEGVLGPNVETFPHDEERGFVI